MHLSLGSGFPKRVISFIVYFFTYILSYCVYKCIYIYIYEKNIAYVIKNIVSAASRDSATAQVYRHFLFLLQNTTEHLADKSSKPSPNRSPKSAESVNKTSLERWRRRNAIFWDRPQAPGTHDPIYGLHFISRKVRKNMKNAIEQLY